jgi:hypothetical protein
MQFRARIRILTKDNKSFWELRRRFVDAGGPCTRGRWMKWSRHSRKGSPTGGLGAPRTATSRSRRQKGILASS